MDEIKVLGAWSFLVVKIVNKTKLIVKLGLPVFSVKCSVFRRVKS